MKLPARPRRLLVTLALASGCADAELELPEYTHEGCLADADCPEGEHCIIDAAASQGNCEALDDPPPPEILLPRLDILVVVDDSSGMATEQKRLATAIGAIFDELSRFGADYRIAFTSTSLPHPLCSDEARGGELLVRSCREHLDDFVSAETGEDARARACQDLCPEEVATIDRVPTTLGGEDGEGAAEVRPWLEGRGDESNLAAGIAMADAWRCALPQGIAGCSYEQPLEAVRQALLRFEDPEDPAYGFLRAGVRSVLIIVTDELDCSWNPNWPQIWDPSGPKVFWNDPEAPTSSICANASLDCHELGETTICELVDRGIDGEVLDQEDFAEAVLMPTWRPWDVPGGFTHSLLIAGRPPDFVDGEVDAGPEFELEYGIGAACESVETLASTCASDDECNGDLGELCGASGHCEKHEYAVPDFRTRDRYSQWELSACEPDYGPTLAEFARELVYEAWTPWR